MHKNYIISTKYVSSMPILRRLVSIVFLPRTTLIISTWRHKDGPEAILGITLMTTPLWYLTIYSRLLGIITLTSFLFHPSQFSEQKNCDVKLYDPSRIFMVTLYGYGTGCFLIMSIIFCKNVTFISILIIIRFY